MKKMTRVILLSALTLSSTVSFSVPPRKLITHNKTSVETNAYVAGTIPSRYPTKANSDGEVSWTEVRMACFGHIVNGKCAAVVRMATGPNDGGTPIDLGVVSVDLNTGIITPSYLSANGYTLIVNGPGETTITKN